MFAPRRPMLRYYLRSILPIALMVGLLLLGKHWLPEAPPWRQLVLLSPLLPIAMLYWQFLRYLRECDELERKVEVDALGLSAIATALLAVGGALLGADAAFETRHALLAVLVVQTGVYGLARIWLRWRYA